MFSNIKSTANHSFIQAEYSYNQTEVVEQGYVRIENKRSGGKEKTATYPIGEANEKCRANQGAVFLKQ